MRLILTATTALAALMLAACGGETKPTEPAKTAETTPAPVETHAMPMDDSMKMADTGDDANMAETADGYTFHTFPAKVESVHLPTAAGEVWTATASDAALVEVGEQKDETMPDGKLHHVVKVTPKASGNATVKFEKRAKADAPVTETRTINFMIH
jgi:hypothetical protein